MSSEAEDNSKKKKKQNKHEQKLIHQLEQLQAERDKLFEKFQRISADYANYQKRCTKQVAEAAVYEKQSVVKALLPVLDNFEHTINGAAELTDAQAMAKAVQIIYEQMIATLKNLGIEQIQAAGLPFDPSCHEAVMQQSEPEKEAMLVLQEFQKGYKLGDKILRPSKVIVNKPQVQNQNDQQQDDNNNDNDDDSNCKQTEIEQ